MDLDSIKTNLYSPKVAAIMRSEHEYTYRHACEFILEQYKTLSSAIADDAILSYILPVAALPDFEITDCSDQALVAQVDLYGKEQSVKISDIKLLFHQDDEEDFLAELIFFKNSKLDWRTTKERVNLLSIEQREKILAYYFQNHKNCRDELNFFTYTFELAADFTTIEKLRHAPHQALLIQDINLINGYYSPPEIIDAGFQSEYIMAIKRATQAYKELGESFPQVAKYLIPLAFLQKILFTVNINQLQKLNFEPAKELWERIKKVHPTIYMGLKP
jgi:hypothetical protein